MAEQAFDINKVNIPVVMTAMTSIGVSIAGTVIPKGVLVDQAAFAMSLAPEAMILMSGIAPGFGARGETVMKAAKTAQATAETAQAIKKASSGFDFMGFLKGTAAKGKAAGEAAARKVAEQTLGRLLKTVKPTKNFLPEEKFDQLLSKGGAPGTVIKKLPAPVYKMLFKFTQYLVNVTGSVMEQGGEAAVLFKQVLALAPKFAGMVKARAAGGLDELKDIAKVSKHGFIDERIGKDVYPIFPRFTPWWNLVHRMRDKYSPCGISSSGAAGAVIGVGSAVAGGGVSAGMSALAQVTIRQILSNPARYWSYFKVGPLRWPLIDRPGAAGVLRKVFKLGQWDPESKAPIIGVISAAPLFPRLYNLWDATAPTKSMSRKARFFQKAVALGYTKGECESFMVLMARPDILTSSQFGFVKSGYTRSSGGRPKHAKASAYKFVKNPKSGKPGFYGRPKSKKRKN